MASLTIRNLDNRLKAQLRLRAAQHGRSMEAEARNILRQILAPAATEKNIAVVINNRFQSLAVESLPIPARQSVRNQPDFSE